MQHSIKDLWLYPFPEIDVVHTQEPLLPEPELTTPGRCICCRQNVRHRFRLDDSWPLRQLTDTISDTRVRLNKATEHLDKLKKRGEPVATGEKEKYNTAVKAAERALEHARLSARRLSLRHVQKAEITSTESLSEKEQELFHEDGPPYSLCAFCHAWHSLNGYAAAQGVMVWLSGYTRFMINPETRVIAVDLNNVAGDKTPAGRLKTGIMYLLAGQIAGGDFTLPQYRDEVLKQLPREYHEIALKRINQLDQEVKTKVYDELHNARGIDFIWENLDTQEREQRKFAIRTVLSTQYLRDYPESVLKSANTLWLIRYKPEDIPVLRDNFNVPEFMLKRFLKMPEGPAPDGSGVPVLGVFRVKSGTLARILKFTVGPLELWALNSSPKDSALRKTLTNKLGSVRARKILAENFPRGSATSLIEHRAGQHNSDNVIEELASELIRKQGYNL